LNQLFHPQNNPNPISIQRGGSFNSAGRSIAGNDPNAPVYDLRFGGAVGYGGQSNESNSVHSSAAKRSREANEKGRHANQSSWARSKSPANFFELNAGGHFNITGMAVKAEADGGTKPSASTGAVGVRARAIPIGLGNELPKTVPNLDNKLPPTTTTDNDVTVAQIQITVVCQVLALANNVVREPSQAEFGNIDVMYFKQTGLPNDEACFDTLIGEKPFSLLQMMDMLPALKPPQTLKPRHRGKVTLGQLQSVLVHQRHPKRTDRVFLRLDAEDDEEEEEKQTAPQQHSPLAAGGMEMDETNEGNIDVPVARPKRMPRKRDFDNA
jgi:hypothetical protein